MDMFRLVPMCFVPLATRAIALLRLKYMRALAQAWPTPAIVQQAVAQLPWPHIVTLLDKLKEPGARNGYAAQSLEHGWSRNVLAMQIDTHAYSRAGAAITHLMRGCHLRSPIWRAKHGRIRMCSISWG